MTETEGKKGKLKVTFEVEVNEELLDLAKKSIEKMPAKVPEFFGHGQEKKE